MLLVLSTPPILPGHPPLLVLSARHGMLVANSGVRIPSLLFLSCGSTARLIAPRFFIWKGANAKKLLAVAGRGQSFSSSLNNLRLQQLYVLLLRR